MTTLEVLQGIFQDNLGIAPDASPPDANLEALNVDSLAMIEVLFAVEDAFGITIPSESAAWRDHIQTVGDLVDYVERIISTQRVVTDHEPA